MRKTIAPQRKSLGPTKRQQVRLPDWMWNALQARAEAELCTVSDLVRRAVMRHFFVGSDASNPSARGQYLEHSDPAGQSR